MEALSLGKLRIPIPCATLQHHRERSVGDVSYQAAVVKSKTCVYLAHQEVDKL